VSIDDGESASILIWCKSSHRATGKFLASRFASEDEQPVAPGGRKYAWHRHLRILFPALFDRRTNAAKLRRDCGRTH
jgi:hypothetical protein